MALMSCISKVFERSWIQIGKGAEYWSIKPSNTFYMCQWQCPSHGLPNFTECMSMVDNGTDSRCPRLRIYESTSGNEKNRRTNEFQTNPSPKHITLAQITMRSSRVYARKKTPWEPRFHISGSSTCCRYQVDSIFSQNIPAIRLGLTWKITNT